MAAEQAVKIAVLGPVTRFTDIVRAFIRKNYRDGILVEAEQAEVCIIDLDAYGAAELLQDQRQRYPERPVIALSLRDSGGDGVIWLKKPFQADELAQALDRVRARKPPVKLVLGERTGGSLHQAAAGVAGKHRTCTRYGWADAPAGDYNPADYLQGLMIKAYRQATLTGIALRLETGWEPILVFPKVRRVWVSADDNKLHAFCRLPLKTFARLNGNAEAHPIGIHPEPSAAFLDPPEPLQAMDAFLWKVAWWNSGGRLPVGIQATLPVRLKHWPNLSRYLCSPHAVRICALLFQKPMSPLDAAELLGVAPADVFAFLSAASALGLVEQLRAQAQVHPEPPAPSQHSGLLRRILQRLWRE